MIRYKVAFEEILGFSRSMDRMLSSILLGDNRQAPPPWRPPTDVYETDHAVEIVVEIAGMDPDKIQVEFHDNILTISGRREDKHRQANCHCLEVQYGDFASEIYLPGQYDLEAINAEYRDGFLTITIPKVRLEAYQVPIREGTVE